jgi:hypothetical protein
MAEYYQTVTFFFLWKLLKNYSHQYFMQYFYGVLFYKYVGVLGLWFIPYNSHVRSEDFELYYDPVGH